jgi:hypothetical protein
MKQTRAIGQGGAWAGRVTTARRREWETLSLVAPSLLMRGVSRTRETIIVTEPIDQGSSFPAWHRGVYALAAAPMLLFTLMGWEEGGAITFGVPTLICVGLACRPSRLGAAILFWPFTAMACLYGYLLVKDLLVLSQGGAPSVLLDADDSVVFVLLELTFIAVSGLFFVMWRSRAVLRQGA